MHKTIYLKLSNRFTTITTRLLFIVIGVYFLSAGIVKLREVEKTQFDVILMIINLIVGVFYLTMSYFIFTKNPKYAQRMAFDDQGISYKSNVFKPIISIAWDKIKTIELRPYRINFTLVDRKESFSYTTPDSVSVEIKKTVREFADSRNITITGG